MLFRTSVFRCLIQRKACCASKQNDPITTKPEFSHCTFCFQNIKEYSKISSWAKQFLLETNGEGELKSFTERLMCL